MDDNPSEENRPEGFRVLRPDPDEPQAEDDDVELPHWTEPGTGQVPAISDDDDDDEELDAWSALGDSEPRWRDESVDYDDFSDLRMASEGEDLPGPTDPEPVADDLPTTDPGEPDPFSFDDLGAGAPAIEPPDFGTPVIPAVSQPAAPTQQPPAGQGAASGAGSDRNLSMALGVGAALAGIAILAFFLGPEVTVGLVTILLVLAAAELFENLRRVGYQPATLLGLAAVAAFPLAAWWRGESGYPLVMALIVMAGLCWYLFGVGTERPVPNLGVSLLTIFYVGGLGSFAALLLKFPHGIGMLISVILCTVAYDIGGYFVGRSVGRQPLSAASPNKTIEGLVGGFIASIVVGMIIVGLIGIDGYGPDTGELMNGVLLGITIGIVAPLGDLVESMIKRDLGVKDMGTILPGHGGLLDRFDTMLFALPASYYLARLLDIPLV